MKLPVTGLVRGEDSEVIYFVDEAIERLSRCVIFVEKDDDMEALIKTIKFVKQFKEGYSK